MYSILFAIVLTGMFWMSFKTSEPLNETPEFDQEAAIAALKEHI